MPRTKSRPASRGGGTTRQRANRGVVSGLLAPLTLSVLVVGIAVAAATYTYQVTYDGRIYLGVSSMGVDLGGYTPDEARTILAASTQRFAKTPIVLRHQGQEWRALPEELGIQLRVQDTVDAAYAVGREGGLLQRLQAQIESIRRGRSVGRPDFAVDSARRLAYLASLAREFDRPPQDARLLLKPGQQIVVEKARPGRKLNVDRTSQLIDEETRRRGAVARPQDSDALVVDLAVDEVQPAIAEQSLAPVVERAQKLVSAPLVLRLDGRAWTLGPEQIHGLLAIREVGSGGQKRYDVEVDETRLRAKLEEIAKESEVKPRNARFDYSGGRLKVIWPGAEGRRIDVPAAAAAVKTTLAGTARVVDLPAAPVKPSVGPDDGPKLGIRELIEQASTPYDVGTAERRFNVELAASRLHGVVVAPGEVFSFNDEVGEVSYRSGYKQGYGITQSSSGEIVTIPSEGGGICQVATTLFHSVFWAGYQIVERNWHLYWIPRYGLPPKGLKGLDATIDQVYDRQGNLVSSVDFRFRNNSESYVLIQARYDRKNLTFQLYGTKPRWQVKVSEPKIENEVKADPTPVYQLDPKMAPGAEMMIESAQDGFQATITRVVTQDGKVLEQRSFTSIYRPSRNVYVHGPKPTPSPSPAPRSTPSPGPSPQATPTATRPAAPPSTPQPTRASAPPRTTPTPVPAKPTPRP